MSYFALVDISKSPGVVQKIHHTVGASQALGMEARSCIFPVNMKGVRKLLVSLALTRSDIVFLRFSDLLAPIWFFILVLLRMKGKKIVIDVPTPRLTGISEIDMHVKSSFKRLTRKAINYASSSWVLWPANLIVQYADDGAWFEYGVKHKTLKIGNGIAIKEGLPLTHAAWPDTTLQLVGVAQIASWHGYDRLLRAMALVKAKGDLPYDIHFTLAGEGDALNSLKSLATDLCLLNDVTFTGYLTGRALDDVLSRSHVGVASLGLYRKGLQESSDLKVREYISRGLSIIAAGKDPDFPSCCSFRFTVGNDDGIEDIVEVLSSFEFKTLCPAEELHKYAKEHLSIEGKVKMILVQLL